MCSCGRPIDPPQHLRKVKNLNLAGRRGLPGTRVTDAGLRQGQELSLAFRVPLHHEACDAMPGQVLAYSLLTVGWQVRSLGWQVRSLGWQAKSVSGQVKPVGEHVKSVGGLV